MPLEICYYIYVLATMESGEFSVLVTGANYYCGTTHVKEAGMFGFWNDISSIMKA